MSRFGSTGISLIGTIRRGRGAQHGSPECAAQTYFGDRRFRLGLCFRGRTVGLARPPRDCQHCALRECEGLRIQLSAICGERSTNREPLTPAHIHKPTQFIHAHGHENARKEYIKFKEGYLIVVTANVNRRTERRDTGTHKQSPKSKQTRAARTYCIHTSGNLTRMITSKEFPASHTLSRRQREIRTS